MKKINIRLSSDEFELLGITPTASMQKRITEEQLDRIKQYRQDKPRTRRRAPHEILEPASQMSAYTTDGKLMNIDEYCSCYGIDRAQVKSYKLVSHSSVPYYNLQSSNIELVNGITQEEFTDNLIEKLKSHSPNYNKIPNRNKESKNLLVIDPADVHIGKLATAYETGEDYNSSIAYQRCIEGVNGIVDKSRNFGIDKVLFVIGNDILHVDNARRTTTSGTPQDTDGMFYDMFNIALSLYVEIIESLIQEFDVDILFCPSNHDYVSSWQLARTLSAWFRNCDRVTIDDSISHRKYYQYGKNLIGLSHGDGAKMADMPLLMANEAPKMWADTIFRYSFLHHIHHKQRNHFQSGKDHIGVTVEYLRSPSAADSWHYRNGYVGAKKAIEGFIHSFEDGQIARLTHYFS